MLRAGPGRTAPPARKTSGGRDQALGGLHALGKLLNAKRGPLPPNSKEKRGPLEFSPEHVVETNDMALPSIASFLSHHAPAFFTDVHEMSAACASLSDAELFVGKLYAERDRSETTYPEQYAVSLLGRTVAASNLSPAPSTFRPLNKPPM